MPAVVSAPVAGISHLRKSVLIFGSGGTLGSAVAHAFAAAQWRVIGCSSGWYGLPLQDQLESRTRKGRSVSASVAQEGMAGDAEYRDVARGSMLASQRGGGEGRERTVGIAERGATTSGREGRSAPEWPRFEKWHRSVRGWRAIAAPPHAVVDIATQSFERAFSLQRQGEDLLAQLQPLLAAGPPLRAAICCSGAFDMTPPGSPFFLDEAQRLIKANCWPALLCAHTAAVLQQERPTPLLLVLTGAAGVAQSDSSPSMIAYGCAKTYVHHLVRSLAAASAAETARSSISGSAKTTVVSGAASTTPPKKHNTKLGSHHERGKSTKTESEMHNHKNHITETELSRPSLRVVGLLPTILDTPANRADMPRVSESVRASTWTDVRDVAQQLLNWAENPEEIENGQFCVVSTHKGKTKFTLL